MGSFMDVRWIGRGEINTTPLVKIWNTQPNEMKLFPDIKKSLAVSNK